MSNLITLVLVRNDKYMGKKGDSIEVSDVQAEYFISKGIAAYPTTEKTTGDPESDPNLGADSGKTKGRKQKTD